MAFPSQTWCLRPGWLEKGVRKNPGILSVEEKYELTAHESSKDCQSWSYVCKYRKTPKIKCLARAKIGKFENKWFLQSLENNHTLSTTHDYHSQI